MNKINKLLMLGFLVLLISGARAGTWIYSNIVTVKVNTYVPTLSVAPSEVNRYNNVTLIAHLWLNNGSAGAGHVIEFGIGNQTNFLWIGQNYTNALGEAILEYNVTQTEDIHFIARYFS